MYTLSKAVAYVTFKASSSRVVSERVDMTADGRGGPCCHTYWCVRGCIEAGDSIEVDRDVGSRTGLGSKARRDSSFFRLARKVAS